MADKETEILAAEGIEIVVAGENVRVKPYNWIDTLKMAKPLNVILKALYENGGVLNAAISGAEGNEFLSVISLFDRIGNAEEITAALTELIGSAIDKDKAWLEGLMLDEVFALGKSVYEVNKNFFVKRIVPKLPKPDEKEKAAK